MTEKEEIYMQLVEELKHHTSIRESLNEAQIEEFFVFFYELLDSYFSI